MHLWSACGIQLRARVVLLRAAQRWNNRHTLIFFSLLFFYLIIWPILTRILTPGLLKKNWKWKCETKQSSKIILNETTHTITHTYMFISQIHSLRLLTNIEIRVIIYSGQCAFYITWLIFKLHQNKFKWKITSVKHTPF